MMKQKKKKKPGTRGKVGGVFQREKMGCTNVEGLLLNLDHVHFVFRFYCLLLDLIKGRITSVLREAC